MNYNNISDKQPLSLYRRIMADKYGRGEVIPWWKIPVTYHYNSNQYICTILGFHIPFRLLLVIWRFFRMILWDTEEYYRGQQGLRGITRQFKEAPRNILARKQQ